MKGVRYKYIMVAEGAYHVGPDTFLGEVMTKRAYKLMLFLLWSQPNAYSTECSRACFTENHRPPVPAAGTLL